jgi:type II secretory pathway component PulJ
MTWLLSPAGRVVLVAGALVALSGSIWWHGYASGQDAATARHEQAVRALQRDLDAVSDIARAAEAARLQIERERNDLLAELDVQGASDAGADRLALPAGSVSRISAIGR